MDKIECRMVALYDTMNLDFGGKYRARVQVGNPMEYKNLNVRIPSQVRDRLVAYCIRNNHSQTQFVEKVLEWHLNYLEARESE